MGVRTIAGRSAGAAYRRARMVNRRRRRASGGLVLLCAGFVVAGLATAASGSGGLTAAWLLALGILGTLWARRIWPRDDPARWSRGSAGERATSARLARLPRRRWTVLHDLALPHSRANVDHVVIGPSGVWVVDTKAYRAPLGVARGRVWAGEHPVAVEQVAWEAEQVAELLDTDVRPIVAVHGAGLRRRGKRCDGVPVVPADRLVTYIRRRRRALTSAEVSELAERAAEVLVEYR